MHLITQVKVTWKPYSKISNIKSSATGPVIKGGVSPLPTTSKRSFKIITIFLDETIVNMSHVPVEPALLFILAPCPHRD